MKMSVEGTGLCSGTYLGIIICITLIAFIAIMRAFDHKLRMKFISAAAVLLLAHIGEGIVNHTVAVPHTISLALFILIFKYVCLMITWIIVCDIVVRDISRQSTRDVLTIVVMLAMVVVGGILEQTKILMSCTLPSSAIGILFLYMYMYAERYNVDSVSKCYKRRCFYSDAEKHSKSKMAIISMDLNDLKYINDNYGHKAGDIALLTFAEVCRSVKPKKFVLYRTGGDEFMILGNKASRDEAEALTELIREKLRETPYTCSFGIYMYNPGEDFDSCVVKADQAMYDDKRVYKESKTKRSHPRSDEYEERLDNFTNNISFLD